MFRILSKKESILQAVPFGKGGFGGHRPSARAPIAYQTLTEGREAVRRTMRMSRHSWQKAKKIAVLAFLLCFITTVLLAEAFMHEHEQVCAGGNCAVCAHSVNAKNLGQAGNTAYALNLPAPTAVVCCVPLAVSNTSLTPVDLKIRLNN